MAAEIDVWNPSFDVTPASLIEGIITEHGLVPRAAPAVDGDAGAARGRFQARHFLRGLGLLLSEGAGKGDGGSGAGAAAADAAADAPPGGPEGV